MDDELLQYLAHSPYFCELDSLEQKDQQASRAFFVELPTKIREFLVSTETSDTFLKITEKYELRLRYIKSIGKIICEIAIGRVFLGDSIPLISSILKDNRELASEITKEIIEQVLAPIIEEIKKTQQEKFTERLNSYQPIQKSFVPTQPMNKNNIIDLRTPGR